MNGAPRAALFWLAIDMKIDDWVISPSSTHGLILVGRITGDYRSNFHNELGLPEKMAHRLCEYAVGYLGTRDSKNRQPLQALERLGPTDGFQPGYYAGKTARDSGPKHVTRAPPQELQELMMR